MGSTYANHRFNTRLPPPSDTGPAFHNTGEISYSRDGNETHIQLVDVNLARVEQDREMINRALDKLAGIWEPVALEASEVSEDIEPVVDVLQTLGEELEEIKQQQALRQGRKKALKRAISEEEVETASPMEFPGIDEQLQGRIGEVSEHNQWALDQTLEVLEARQRQVNRILEDAPLSETARGYLVALKDVIVEQIHDIGNHPVRYGVAVAEVLPLGIGTATTLGYQGYDIYAGEQTVGGAAIQLTAEGIAGYVGAKALKAGWKFVKGISTKTMQKVRASRVAKRVGGEVDSTNAHSAYWNKHIEFKGNKVYQRDDLIDLNFVDKKGRTNLERMQMGRAPTGPDMESIELHHMLQTPEGAIAEVTKTFHKENHRIIHINPSSIPSSIDRDVFKGWRESYWKMRAKDFE